MVPTTQPPTFTKEQIEEAWTEHTAPDSTKYYYNAVTKQSTYTKPHSLKDEQETTGSVPIDNEEPKRTWSEYTDPSTGKKYYSDGATTTWTRPEEMEELAESVYADEDEAPKKKRKKKASENDVPAFSSKEEAVAAFKGLLLVKAVQPTTKWNDVVKLCSSDSRWEACELLPLGERKQALAEYQTKRANELRELERQERMRAKDAFVQMLTEKLPLLPNFSATNSQLSDIRAALSKDDRFYAVEKEETRESLFLDFCEEVRKRDERKRWTKKRETKDAFFEFLKECEESGSLTFASTWYESKYDTFIQLTDTNSNNLPSGRSSFVGSLGDIQRSDPRIVVSSSMLDSERELYFADFMLELQNAEEERRRRIREVRKRAEKAQKESFSGALRKMASEGVLRPKSRWRDVEAVIAADSSYRPVEDLERDAPREMFEDFIEEWNEIYGRDRAFLSSLVHSSKSQRISVFADTTYEKFSKALLDEAAHSPDLHSDTRRILNRDDPVSSARLYFDELVERARQDQTASSARRASLRRGLAEESSEDEGEIPENSEVVAEESGSLNEEVSEAKA